MNSSSPIDQTIDRRVGCISLNPAEPIIAGSIGQWVFKFTAGSYGVDEGGTIILSQRTACDWEVPQLTHPDRSGYTTVCTGADVRLEARFEPKKDIRPWQKWCFVIDIHDGFISPGEKVIITLGDQSRGASGIRAQTFAESAHEFRFLVDPTNANLPVRLPSSPVVPIIPGPADRLVCIIPSQVIVGEKKPFFVRADDAWGNPTSMHSQTVSIAAKNDIVVINGYEFSASNPGVFKLKTQTGSFSCVSNPCVVHDAATRYRRYWGDLHAQTGNTVGTGTYDEYFTFARDVARLDFTSHQANDFMVSNEDWRQLSDVVKRYHQPGRFIVFPGYEWSGNTPCGGDHNVIYLNDDQPIFRSSHWQIPDVKEDHLSPANPVTELYDRLKGRQDVILIPHVGGRFADVSNYFDPDLIPLVEIVSCWGIFEWMLWDCLEKGYQVGVVCNSDGHKGRPGAESPGAGIFGIPGGLTCVLAEELTRQSIFGALKQRRCYGTTGSRIFLDFTANGFPMGSIIRSGDSVNLSARTVGAAPIESMILFEGSKAMKEVVPDEFLDMRQSSRIRITWQGARIRGRARRARWDGRIHVEGNKIAAAKEFAFDSPSSGIETRDHDQVDFRSGTTGDVDGIDLFLAESHAGSVKFDSLPGHCKVDLSRLTDAPKVFDFGGLDLKVRIRRYPMRLYTDCLSLEHKIKPVSIPKAYFIKVIQEDGQMAWSSPIYLI
jgi:hypothetical protein